VRSFRIAELALQFAQTSSWKGHPEVPRERVVATAMNALWIGFERTQKGEAWS
jgi:hypothetical protein